MNAVPDILLATGITSNNVTIITTMSLFFQHAELAPMHTSAIQQMFVVAFWIALGISHSLVDLSHVLGGIHPYLHTFVVIHGAEPWVPLPAQGGRRFSIDLQPIAANSTISSVTFAFMLAQPSMRKAQSLGGKSIHMLKRPRSQITLAKLEDVCLVATSTSTASAASKTQGFVRLVELDLNSLGEAAYNLWKLEIADNHQHLDVQHCLQFFMLDDPGSKGNKLLFLVWKWGLVTCPKLVPDVSGQSNEKLYRYNLPSCTNVKHLGEGLAQNGDDAPSCPLPFGVGETHFMWGGVFPCGDPDALPFSGVGATHFM
ncbi:hypothetical protein CBOM_01718 [Ceraceosorus bombacis]|uniref:Uncharacterized protein n=1 Tax=Ceraceosorus bombacis TaxID=401625 RepID=A0A0P1BCR7_9BASI|nr:hypothetical protein CBOM_01718 [Ceraceosorus bombacis]